jgi:hypothetical protein
MSHVPQLANSSVVPRGFLGQRTPRVFGGLLAPAPASDQIISEQTDRKNIRNEGTHLAFRWRLGQRRDDHEEVTYFGAGNSVRCVFRNISRSRWQ